MSIAGKFVAAAVIGGVGARRITPSNGGELKNWEPPAQNEAATEGAIAERRTTLLKAAGAAVVGGAAVLGGAVVVGCCCSGCCCSEEKPAPVAPSGSETEPRRNRAQNREDSAPSSEFRIAKGIQHPVAIAKGSIQESTHVLNPGYVFIFRY